MTNPTAGQQPSLQPPRTEPGPPPPPSTDPTIYDNAQFSLVLGRGLVVDTAPENAKMSVSLLAQAQLGVRLVDGSGVRFGEQVEYEITGYDPTDCALTLRLVHDWRPGQKDDPQREQSVHLD